MLLPWYVNLLKKTFYLILIFDDYNYYYTLVYIVLVHIQVEYSSIIKV